MLAGLLRTDVMSSDLIARLIPALAFIVIVLLMFGLPALAIVAVKYFKFKERELTLEMEFRQKSQHQHLDFENRVQRLEDALAGLEQEVRMRMGIDQPAASLPSRPELAEGPAAPDAPARVRAKS
jgi:hypothetical protein